MKTEIEWHHVTDSLPEQEEQLAQSRHILVMNEDGQVIEASFQKGEFIPFYLGTKEPLLGVEYWAEWPRYKKCMDDFLKLKNN